VLSLFLEEKLHTAKEDTIALPLLHKLTYSVLLKL